ncbi:unnamed protein product, partial [Ectocarpus fasciculatus]
LSLLLFLSPVYGAFWLLLATLYFLFKGTYKNIFIAWGVFFSTWYFFFIVLFSDFEYQIWIGGDHTLKIMIYLCDKYSIHRSPWYIKPFEGFYFQTLLLLHLLSSKLGFPIYVPSLIKVFISFLKYILGGDKGPANCAGEENSKKKGGDSSFFSSPFKGSAASEPKAKTYDDLEAYKHWSPLKSKEGFSGTRYVYYREVWLPVFGRFTGCGSRDASKEEILKDKRG